MKLLTKTTIYIATLSLFLFFIMGIIFFQILKNTSISELNKELILLKDVIEDDFDFYKDNRERGFPGVDSLFINEIETGEAGWYHLNDTIMYERA